jgi:hypothetical protein
MKLIRCLMIFSMMFFVYSCSGGESPAKSTAKKEQNTSNEKKPERVIETVIEITGTTIFGTVLDTAYNSLEDVKVSTRPKTIDVFTDEEGEFSLSSDQFIYDLSYDIVYTHIDYEQKTTSGFYPDIDEKNDRGLILMIPLEIDGSIKGPGGKTLPPTPPDLPGGGGRD